MSGWLLVNRDICITDRTRQRVNSRGLNCDTAHNWRTAEQRLVANDYDVILVDEQVETGDDRNIFEHLAEGTQQHDGKIVLLGEHANDDCSGISNQIIRCENMMLANIDELIASIG